MRPTRLEIEGFSTFAAPTELVFDEVDLVAFVGPTGSGKSTLIDAITFALYGSVARYDDARLVAPVINQRSNEAKVRLDFELGGMSYTAVRVVRRTKTGATTKEARLETATGVVASGAKELTSAVEELVGLDFAQFTRTVVLPQGQFADFLQDDAASRQKLLRRLLDLELYSRMGSLARERAKAAKQQIEALTTQRSRFSDATEEARLAIEGRVGALVEFGTTANIALDELLDVDERLSSLRREVLKLDANLSALTAVQSPAALETESSELAGAVALFNSRQSISVELRTQQGLATDALLELGDPALIQSQLDAYARVSVVAQQQQTHEESLATQVLRLDDATKQVGVAEQLVELATARVRAAQAGLDVQAWTQRLAIGQNCPVCEQVVEEIPDHDRSAELSDATADESSASMACKQAQRQQRGLQADIDATAAQIDGLRQEQSRLATSLEGVAASTELRVRLEQAEAVKATRRERAVQLERSEAECDVASVALERLRQRESSRRSEFGLQRDSVASMNPPQPQADSLAADWLALVQWSQAQIAGAEEQRRLLAADGKAAATRKAELLSRLHDDANAIELSLEHSEPSEIKPMIARAQATAEGELKRAVERLAQLRQLDTDIDELDQQRTLQAALGQQLSATGFERWLLVEAMEDLVARATVRLLELSQGQYSLTNHDTAFRIVDHHNADETRDVRTLSGGETFLASLALALALSDSIADMAQAGAPRLGSVFLDEGFGTLDPNTLDTVAVAIEELSARGRLVGIVTHIDALAERMPMRFVVEKGPATSTVRRMVS